MEECSLGLKVSDLQQTINLFRKSLALMDKGTLYVGQGKIFGALKIIEVG